MSLEISDRYHLMMKSRQIIYAALAAFACLVASGLPAGAKHAWSGWAPGSSITFERIHTLGGQTTRETVMQTLKSADKVQANVRETSSLRSPATTLTYFDITGFPTVGYGVSPSLKSGEETLVIDGKTFNCDVTQRHSTWFPPCGNDDKTKVESDITSWSMHDDPKNQVRTVVKRTTYYKDGHKPKFDAVASESKLVHFKLPVVIDNQAILCDVYETTEPPTQTKTLEWRTAAIPLGFVKRQIIRTGQHSSEYTETLLHINHRTK